MWEIWVYGSVFKILGKNVTLLKSKITGGDLFLPEVQHEQNVVSIRFKDGTRIVHTAYMVDKIYLITTAKFIPTLCSWFINKDGNNSTKKVSEGKISGLQSQIGSIDQKNK